MKNRMMSLLLALILCMGLTVPAMAGGTIPSPYCATNSGQFIAYLDVAGSGEGWSFDPATNVLTLDGFEGKGLNIYNTTEPLTICLADGSVNTLTAIFQTEDTKGVIFTGSGTLNIQSNNGGSMIVSDGVTIESGTITTNERIQLLGPLNMSGGLLTSSAELEIQTTGSCNVTGGTIVLDTASSAIEHPSYEATGMNWTTKLETASVVGKDGQPLTPKSSMGITNYYDAAGNLAAYAKITAGDSAVQPLQETTDPTQPAESTGFSDVAKNAYYAEPVQWAVAQGITNGTSDTTFSPDQTCTRAQIITFLWRAAGCPEPAISNPFDDVAAGSYYEKAVTWAAEQGMVSGTSCAPDEACTRLMAAEFMWKQAGNPLADSAGFSDVSSPAVDWAVAQGITNGTGENTFGPDEACTRAQIATFLFRGFAE